MNFKPSLDVAKNSVKQCIKEFNESFTGEYNVQQLEELKLKFETAFKSLDANYLENFKQYTIIEIVLIIMEALSLDRVDNLTLSEEEINLAAQELYEHWV